MATIKSKNRRQLIPSVKQQSKERARQGERERDAGISTYSGWMCERNGALSLAAAWMLPPPLKSFSLSLSEVLKQPAKRVEAAAAVLWWWRWWRVAAEDQRSDFCESLHHSE